jgi:hypothetical protein
MAANRHLLYCSSNLFDGIGMQLFGFRFRKGLVCSFSGFGFGRDWYAAFRVSVSDGIGMQLFGLRFRKGLRKAARLLN